MLRSVSSVKHTPLAFNVATLLLRVIFGALMIPHGYAKFVAFGEKQHEFMNFLGLGSPLSMGLAIFAEMICSALLIAGFFTRAILVPLIVTTLVIVFKAHGADIFGEAEHGTLFLTAYVTLMLLGPGKYSLDGLTTGKR